MNNLYDALDDTPTYYDIETYHIEKYKAYDFIDPLYVSVEKAGEQLKLSLSAQFYSAQAIPPIEYPKDWWQAFKQRWFPNWLLKKYPVEYKRVLVYKHLMNVPVRKDYFEMYTTRVK